MRILTCSLLALVLTGLAPMQPALAEKSQQIPVSAETPSETATLAAGCFWGTQEFFRKFPGVVESRVGYTGGSLKNPNYSVVSSGDSGHAESLEIKFDPKKTSYREILVSFFKMHDPTTANQQGNDRGTQYRSAIFYHSPEQQKVAVALIQQIEKSGAWKGKITTEVAPASTFYAAEDYHQNYLVKNPGGYDNHYFRKISFDVPTLK